MVLPYRPSPQLWSSSARFVIVCTAAIVSLGDFWRLPYLLSTYGGSAFLLIYLLALVLMGVPVFSAQVLMARGSHTDVPGVVSLWTRNKPHSRFWIFGAYATLVGALLLLSAYAVIASWSLAYCMRAVFGGLPGASVAQSAAHFVTFARDGERGLGWLLLFVLLLVATTARGLQRGTEPVMRTLAACMLGVLTLLLVVTIWQGPASGAARHLLYFDPAAVGARGVLEALYQAFFSLSLGTGVIVALASHLPARAPAVRLSAIVIVASQIIALAFALVLASLMPGVGLEFSAGVQRVFEVLPVGVKPVWTMALLFILLAMISMTTGIGLFETLVQTVSHRARVPRLQASVYTGVLVAALGLMAQNAFGVLSSWRMFGRNLFDWFSLISTHWLIPITGLMLCVLVGRVLARRRLIEAWSPYRDEAGMATFALWHGLLRYPARIALIAVVAYALGALDLIEAIWNP
ncbi:sodium-dependent transporter [Salinisphaera hydrothermalis]|uniref:Sodium-dependent transporter family protein n=1 Tax=Salinisphaera hydrothermalis (strain C41B8) TaxID=1304275 RepID=A0A084IJR8_SALHC|nr:sodium-dependent transporter [Salinisphaera hydrothermalis]KEZ76952.1 Sodium-dependent transporter family protein [Salinisphaera hydrothermalis C41B8]